MQARPPLRRGSGSASALAAAVQSLVIESLADAGEERFILERLGEIATDAGGECALPSPLVRIGRGQNGRNGVSGRSEMFAEIETAHARHVHVCDNALHLDNVGRRQEILSRLECLCRPPYRPY